MKVAVLLGFGVAVLDLLPSVFAASGFDITDGDDLDIGLTEEAVQVTSPHHADTEEAQLNAIVRSGSALSRGGAGEGGGAQECGGGDEELSAVEHRWVSWGVGRPRGPGD